MTLPFWISAAVSKEKHYTRRKIYQHLHHAVLKLPDLYSSRFQYSLFNLTRRTHTDILAYRWWRLHPTYTYKNGSVLLFLLRSVFIWTLGLMAEVLG